MSISAARIDGPGTKPGVRTSSDEPIFILNYGADADVDVDVDVADVVAAVAMLFKASMLVVPLGAEAVTTRVADASAGGVPILGSEAVSVDTAEASAL